MTAIRVPRMKRRGFLLLGLAAAGGAWLRPGRGVAAAAEGRAIRVGAVFPAAGRDGLEDAVIEAARMGLRMAEEDLGLNAELFGARLEVLQATAAGAGDALREGRRLAGAERVCALVGGVGREQAEALARAAEGGRVPFLNIAAPADGLRGEACSRFAFHVEASAAMYLDALAAWFVRAGHRRWFFVHEATDEGRALYARAIGGLERRHWGAAEVGRAEVAPGQADYGRVLDAIRRARPDVTLVLLPPQGQLDFTAGHDALGLAGRVTGFPHPATQTRRYFARLAEAAPRAGATYRAALWEATLDAYGARELNSRFMARWGEPMEPPAWAAYQAVRMVFDAAIGAGRVDGAGLVEHLAAQQGVFDVHKGIGVSFRPWDHQLRQPLYLVEVGKAPGGAAGLAGKVGVATLVGELPEIYHPGTDPIERLDQIGDLRRDSRCRIERDG